MTFSGYSRICLEAVGWSVPLMAGACAALGLGLLFEDQLERAHLRGQKAIVHMRIARRRAWRLAAAGRRSSPQPPRRRGRLLAARRDAQARAAAGGR